MIPQNFKDIVSSGDGVGIYQTLALVLFMLFFVGLVLIVFRKPKNYYRDRERASLEEDNKDANI